MVLQPLEVVLQPLEEVLQPLEEVLQPVVVAAAAAVTFPRSSGVSGVLNASVVPAADH